MDPWFLVSLLLAIVVGALALILVRRQRASDQANDRLRAAAAADSRALGEERVRQAAMVEALPVGVLTVDRRLRVVDANPVAESLLRRSGSGLVGRTMMETFLDPAVEALAATALSDAATAATGEVRLAGPDGPVLAIRARRTGPDALHLILEDVSELRRLQRIRTEFIDNLSHELRTPLTTVRLLSETLSREADAAGSDVSPRMRERIAKIEVETGHLVQMVNELLDLSRIEGGGTLDVVDGLDMGRLALESTERLRLFAERQGVSLRVDVGDELRPIRGDAARLGQVVVNLVHNAVKFSPDGGDVTVAVRSDGDDVVTAVEDHGVGIPRADQARVFERFYKVDRARLRAEAGGGTGLGLAIARHVIEQHGGRIWVTSTEGKGSTFSFAIPVSAAVRAGSC